MKSKLLASVLLSIGALGASAQSLPNWASPEVGAAWAQGYKGQGTAFIDVDNYSSTAKLTGNIDASGKQSLIHGVWTQKFFNDIAPAANVYQVDQTSLAYNNGFSLIAGKFNVINASFTSVTYNPVQQATLAGFYNIYGNQLGSTGSIVQYANGQAVVTKSAGNGGSTVLGADKLQYVGTYDALNAALVGKSSAIFVGALNNNGSPTAKQSLASYSNAAGTNTQVQNQFLVVGVGTCSGATPLCGTSFAAPIVAGYAAILHSKFTTATPNTITNRLLTTARTDTLVNYNAATYGRGEASLSRSLAANSIK